MFTYCTICTLLPMGIILLRYDDYFTIISLAIAIARNLRVAGGENEAKLDVRSAANLQLGFRN